MSIQSLIPTTMPFHLIEHAFQTDATLIEASAGTGKTYSIAFLVLRLIVEKAIPIEQILVVTFTKAATEELKDRVRSRLYQARLVFMGASTDDEALKQWVAQVKDREAAQTLLNIALANIDQASIFTIHGFCQRILQEYPLESGQSFGIELTANVMSMCQEIVQDFWRKQVYERSEAEVGLILEAFDTPDALLSLLKSVSNEFIEVEPVLDQSLDDLLKAQLGLLDVFNSWLESHHNALNQFIENAISSLWIDARKVNKLQTLWLSVKQSPRVFFDYFPTAFKKANIVQYDVFIATCQVPILTINALSETIPNIKIAIQQALLKDYFSQLDHKLNAQSLMSFDELIIRLYKALQPESHAPWLIDQVRAVYQVALIDEFQDTDAQQWHIFSSFFNHQTHYLYLIGDPKQAIYKFRGADIYAYLAAKASCQHHYTLDTNWRSVPNMVEAVNQVFGKENPFKIAEVSFYSAKAGVKAKAGAENDSALIWWQMPLKEDKKPWNKDVSKTIIENTVIAEITRLLNDGSYQPQNMAILVKTNQSAREYQSALARVGVPSILNSRDSVYASEQAIELYRLMRAMAHPSDIRIAKQALALPWFGLSAQAYYQAINGAVLESWLDTLQYAQDAWQKKGFIAALMGLLHRQKVGETLALFPDAERSMTNIMHLAELIQIAVQQGHLSITKTIDFLSHEIQDAQSGEDSVLRLETDEDAVQIITMHAAKGLEYPIVFCPHLWEEMPLKDKEVIKVHENNRLIADLGSLYFEGRKAKAQEELNAEGLRLAYVALTRAKERCYVVVGESLKGYEQSPLGYLLASGVPQGLPFKLEVMSENTQPTPYCSQKTDAILSAQSFMRTDIDTHYRMFSFTSLAKNSHHETPDDKSQEIAVERIAIEKPEPSILPKGSHFGNLVHDLLEQSHFSQLAEDKQSSILSQLCAHYGVDLVGKEPLFDNMIRSVVNTPLDTQDVSFKLSLLDKQKILKEMAFYYALPSGHTQIINRLMSDYPEVPYLPLNAMALEGYLNGFIDLVCEHHGKYYVMDYKTNFLGNLPSHYTHQAMFDEMKKHSYGLQFLLYSLAVDRYLAYRIPDYDYEQHFGGIKYLFVRGMDGQTADHGVFSYRPPLGLIQSLQDMMSSVSYL